MMEPWDNLFREKLASLDLSADPSHDLAHFQRVVKTARQLCEEEKARLEVVLPAAWFHDFVVIPKDDPRRAQASRLSAVAACSYLKSVNYPVEFLSDIAHAIEAHSFSAGIKANTLEAQIVQDADRLDGIGAIGIARCFAVCGLMKSRFYDPKEPRAKARALDDRTNAIDHFYVKLFRTADAMGTPAGRAEAKRRIATMESFLVEFFREIGSD